MYMYEVRSLTGALESYLWVNSGLDLFIRFISRNYIDGKHEKGICGRVDICHDEELEKKSSSFTDNWIYRNEFE